MNFDFQTLCNWIVLIGGVTLAITNILKFMGKPLELLHKKQEESYEKEGQHIELILKEALPDALYEHDLQIRDKYKGDRQRYLEDIKDTVLRDINDPLAEILNIQKELKESIEKINCSTKDMLRQRIMRIYNRFKDEGKIPLTARENLDELYKDYTGLGGNSYITKYYKRMLLWEIVNDIASVEDDR